MILLAYLDREKERNMHGPESSMEIWNSAVQAI
jgi:hypothetical protein